MYKCKGCKKFYKHPKQEEYIDHGGLDDMPSVEYREVCPHCGASHFLNEN